VEGHKHAKFELASRQPRKQDPNPVIQVLDGVGLPRRARDPGPDDYGTALRASRKVAINRSSSAFSLMNGGASWIVSPP
jgi:hypothetical protein